MPVPDHPAGKHKAAVFRAVLGLTAAEADVLRGSILRAVVDGQIVIERADEFGDRYHLDFEMTGPAGQARIRSAWIIRTGEDFPRLTTWFVLPE